MPVIYSYPTKDIPTGSDLLIISDVSNSNRTRKTTFDAFRASLNLVDGSGTANRIPLWVDSNTLTDSSFLQATVGGGVSQVGTKGSVLIGVNSGALVNATINQNNVALGDESLKGFVKGLSAGGTETSGENVAVGYQSLTTTTAGTNNVGIGVDTLGSLTLGANNIALGKRALFSLAGTRANTVSNTAIGFDCLGDLTTGKNNVAVGQSIYDVTTSLENAVAIGRWAGKAFTGDADESVVVGANSLISSTATSVKNSVIIGESAGQATSGTLADDILIGTSVFNSTVSAGSNIAIGRVANQNSGASVALTGSIAIGTTGGTAVGSGGTANSYSTVIGSYDTSDAGIGARNSTNGKYSAILGGIGNDNGANYGMIIGGRNNTITTGAFNAAILGGFSNTINGTGSAGMALGSNLIVDGNNQVVIGRWNASNNNTKFIVGAGSSDVDRKNAFEVLNTGQAKLAQYETSSGASFPQAVSADFTFLTAGSVSGDVNQLTPPEVSQLPRYLSVNRRTVTGGTNVNLPSNIGNVEKISWTGADGTVDLRLAALTPDNRVITFIADSSVTGAGKILNIKYQGVLIITLSYDAINTATVWYDKLASPAVFDVISCCSSTPSGGTAFSGTAASSSPPATSSSTLATGATV